MRHFFAFLFLFVFGLTLPFPGIIIPIYFLERAMHIYNTRLAIVLPLIALYMPFAVFWMRAHFVNMPRVLYMQHYKQLSEHIL